MVKQARVTLNKSLERIQVQSPKVIPLSKPGDSAEVTELTVTVGRRGKHTEAATG